MLNFQPLRRKLLQLTALLPLLPRRRLLAARPDGSFRIAFGSCLHQDKPQPVWQAVLADRPDAFIFLGDNIYGDSDDPEVLREKYLKLAGIDGFRSLRERCEVCATWDDHDYGRNDAGSEYPAKEQSRQLMLDFWDEAQDSPRRTQQGGIYSSREFVSEGRTVQVLLLDLRWNRDPLLEVARDEYPERDARNMGPYSINGDGNAVLVGEPQWRWLKAELARPADFRIIASSIQCLAEFTGWETWANFPHERRRLLDLLAEHQHTPTVIVSGDVHWCELSELQDPRFATPPLELTSSGLTETWERISPNRHRVGAAHAVQNYGLISLDWDTGVAGYELKDAGGTTLISASTTLPRR